MVECEFCRADTSESDMEYVSGLIACCRCRIAMTHTITVNDELSTDSLEARIGETCWFCETFLSAENMREVYIRLHNLQDSEFICRQCHESVCCGCGIDFEDDKEQLISVVKDGLEYNLCNQCNSSVSTSIYDLGRFWIKLMVLISS